MKFTQWFLLILMFSCTHQPTSSVERLPNQTVDNLDHYLFEAPFEKMREDNKKESGVEFPAKIKINSQELLVSTWFKGVGRRTQCIFPGIRIDVKNAKDESTQSLIAKMNLPKDFQLLTHCGDAGGSLTYINDFDQYMLRECSVYKFAKALGAPYFETRLVRITYKDSESSAQETHLACILETKKSVAVRMNGSKVYLDKENSAGLIDHGMEAITKPIPIKDRLIDEKDMFLGMVIETFSGNGDWGILYENGPTLPHRLQNFILIPKTKPAEKDITDFAIAKKYKYSPVAHDFNLSSFVATGLGSEYVPGADIEPNYPDANNFEAAEVNYIVQTSFRNFSKETLKWGLAYLTSPTMVKKLREVSTLLPFDTESRKLYNTRLNALITSFKPSNFFRDRIKPAAKIYDTEDSTNPICRFHSLDIVTVTKRGPKRSEVILHSIKPEEVVFCLEIVNRDLIGAKVWVDNKDLTKE